MESFMSRALMAAILAVYSVLLVNSGQASANSCLYSVFPKSGMPGYNLDKEPVKVESAAACMKLCDGNPACLSVDYQRKEHQCFLQSKSRRDAGQGNVKIESGAAHEIYDHFTCETRRCAWVAVPNAAIPGHNIARFEGVSVAECLEKCVANAKCFSADYDNRVRSCDLQNASQHTAELKQGSDIPYDHYTCLNPN